MKRQRFFLLNLIFILIFLSSCKQEEENEPANFLHAKSWKRSLIDKNPSTNPPGRATYYPVLNCEKDDTFQFKSDGALLIDRGTNKCDSNEATKETVTYTYNKAGKALWIDGTKYTLAEESGNQIKYYVPLPSATGYEYVVFLLE